MSTGAEPGRVIDRPGSPNGEPPPTGPLVAVGRIGRAHGLRGDVFVAPWTDDPGARFAEGAVLITDRGPLTVAAARVQGGGRWVVHFVGVDDRTGGEGIHGLELRIAATNRPVLDDPDDFYDTDLIGLAVSTVDGQVLGPVRDVVHAPASDYLLVEVDGAERLIPFVAAIVPAIDLAARTVMVDPPEGLFDL